LSIQAVGAERKEGELLLFMYLHPTVDRSEQRSRKNSPCPGTMLTQDVLAFTKAILMLELSPGVHPGTLVIGKFTRIWEFHSSLTTS